MRVVVMLLLWLLLLLLFVPRRKVRRRWQRRGSARRCPRAASNMGARVGAVAEEAMMSTTRWGMERDAGAGADVLYVCITSFPQETIAGLGRRRGRGRTPATDGEGKGSERGVQCRMGATYDWYPCIASATARLCLRCVSESESIDGMRRTPSRCRSRSWS